METWIPNAFFPCPLLRLDLLCGQPGRTEEGEASVASRDKAEVTFIEQVEQTEQTEHAKNRRFHMSI
jgi:hypothetical protein